MNDDDANNSADTPELAPDGPDQDRPTAEQPDTDHADSEDDAQGADQELEEVDLEGEKLAVPKTTAEKLRAAMLRQADYTRKTQELAQQRQQSESTIAQEKARIEVERAQIQSVARLVSIQDQLKAFEGVNWDALEMTPEVQRARWRFEDLNRQAQGVVNQIQQHESQRALRENEATARALQHANEVLGREIKGWSPEYARELHAVARELGADERELVNIRSPWIVRALHAHKVLRDMTAKAAKAPAPAPAVPVKTVTGASAKPAFDPNKASIDEYMRHERVRLARKGRL